MAFPKEIRKLADGVGMKITWDDSLVTDFNARTLREMCQCAACRNELTGEKLINPENIPADIKILKAQLVGNYALGFLFSDGHSTGIYPFENLRNS